MPSNGKDTDDVKIHMFLPYMFSCSSRQAKCFTCKVSFSLGNVLITTVLVDHNQSSFYILIIIKGGSSEDGRCIEGRAECQHPAVESRLEEEE